MQPTTNGSVDQVEQLLALECVRAGRAAYIVASRAALPSVVVPCPDLAPEEDLPTCFDP